MNNNQIIIGCSIVNIAWVNDRYWFYDSFSEIKELKVHFLLVYIEV